MPFCLTVRCRQIGSDQIPSHFRPHSPSAHAQNIHVIVFDSLLSRKVIVHQRGATPFHLIGADGCTYPTAADRHAPFHFARDNCVSERDDKVWIVVPVIEDVCAEVGNLVASSTQLRNQLFLKSESTVVSGDSTLIKWRRALDWQRFLAAVRLAADQRTRIRVVRPRAFLRPTPTRTIARAAAPLIFRRGQTMILLCGGTTITLSPADEPDRHWAFARQAHFFRFMADHKALAFGQRVLHLLRTDFYFENLAAVGHGKAQFFVLMWRAA